MVVIKAEADQSLVGDQKQKSEMISLVWIVRKRTTLQISVRCSLDNKKQDDDQANASIDEIENELICSLDNSSDSWIMDSDASFHTTPSLELLSNYHFIVRLRQKKKL